MYLVYYAFPNTIELVCNIMSKCALTVCLYLCIFKQLKNVNYSARSNSTTTKMVLSYLN